MTLSIMQCDGCGVDLDWKESSAMGTKMDVAMAAFAREEGWTWSGDGSKFEKHWCPKCTAIRIAARTEK